MESMKRQYLPFFKVSQQFSSFVFACLTRLSSSFSKKIHNQVYSQVTYGQTKKMNKTMVHATLTPSTPSLHKKTCPFAFRRTKVLPLKKHERPLVSFGGDPFPLVNQISLTYSPFLLLLLPSS